MTPAAPSHSSPPATSAPDPLPRHGSGLPLLSLTALGVVFGDIGTSPLYTVKEVFAGAHHPVPISPAHILGILSLITWSLIMVVSVKYALFILRADNKGEGGIMGLMALVLRGARERGQAPLLMLFGLFGAALFYGDGAITPAISVLSAVEGMEIGTAALKPYVVPLTLGVLFGLFAFQRHGTARVGVFFGPVMALWFLVLGALGLGGIAAHPQVLAALNPLQALAFWAQDPRLAFFALASVFLAVTGAEALYADMGHFGRRPIQLAWFLLALPALLLNYYGQGALLLAQPEAIDNPFFRLAPAWLLYPLIGLATAATVIASQAVISGVYSLTHQAMQLGYVPRVVVQHTSHREAGQIYLPGVNWLLFAGVVVLVLGFGSSTALAAAYGIAVCGTMVITTVLAFVVTRRVWHWPLPVAAAVTLVFLAMDLAFLAANASKVADGGWLPLAVGAALFLLMTTWKRGQKLFRARLEEGQVPLEPFLANLAHEPIAPIPGTAVFMTSQQATVPHALLHSLKHYKSLHERLVLLTVVIADEPWVPETERVSLDRLPGNAWRLSVNFGFMDEPDLPAVLPLCAAGGLALDLATTTFFLGRETLLPRRGAAMAYWREQLFVAMFRNASNAAAHFRLPPNRVVELGAQVVL